MIKTAVRHAGKERFLTRSQSFCESVGVENLVANGSSIHLVVGYLLILINY